MARLSGVGVWLAGATLFWSARSVTLAGHGQRLLTALAVGRTRVIHRAHSGVRSPHERAGEHGPRAGRHVRQPELHGPLAALGLPLLLFVAIEARDRVRFALGAAGVALTSGALVLSRSRAAWLGAAMGGVFLVVEGLWVGRLWADDRLRGRVLRLAGTAWPGSSSPSPFRTGSTGAATHPIWSR